MANTESQANREARSAGDTWHLYAGHRARLTALLAEAAAAAAIRRGDGRPRLCLLGAGNAHDVELDTLLAHYGEVHLVDIDSDALAAAQDRLDEASRPRLCLHGGVDLSGILERLDAGPRPETMGEVEALIEPGARGIAGAIPGDFDVVASCCVMSQLHWALDRVEDPESFTGPSLRHATMVIHLRAMALLCAPGGRGLVVNDAVSNRNVDFGDLADADEATLASRLSALALSGHLFEPCNPVLLRRILRRDQALRAQVEEAGIIGHWLWNGAHDLQFLVYALAFSRK